MSAMQKTVIFYKDAQGDEPFTDWLNALRDPQHGGVFLNVYSVLSRAIMVTINRLSMVFMSCDFSLAQGIASTSAKTATQLLSC